MEGLYVFASNNKFKWIYFLGGREMEKKRGKTLIGAIVILSISLVIAASLISNAIDNSGYNIANSNSIPSYQYEPHYADYELLFSDGWMYLHDKTTGQIWRKPELSGEPWIAVEHFTDEVDGDQE